MRTLSRAGLGASIAVAAMLFAGCGGGDKAADGVASLGGGSASNNAPAPAADVPKDPYEKALKFAKCMRDNGIDMPDPTPDETKGGMARAIPGGAGGVDSLNKAMESCRKFSPGSDIDPNDPKVKDERLKRAQCMRSKGIDMPDPEANGGKGMTLDIDKLGGKEAFEKAMKECGGGGLSGAKPAEGGK